MNSLVTINSFQFHRMHRQLLERGGNRKLSDNTYQERWSKPSQQQIQQTKQPSTTSIPAVKLQPLQNDVICARGRKYWDHPGNRFYRKLISLAKKQYSEAPNRPLKTLIVTEIISHMHKNDERFVKEVSHKGGHKWIECSTFFVREKVTQSLRDGLSFKYSSSTSRKRERKIQTQEFFHADICRIVNSNTAVSQKIKDLQQKVDWTNRFYGTENDGVSDEVMLEIFLSANLDILETMKKDPSMLDELHLVKNSERAMKKDNKFPTKRLSSRTIKSSIERPALGLQSASGPARLQSSSKLYNSAVHINDTFQRSSSLIQSMASATTSIEHTHDILDFSCDDMDLDLESRSMFLDDW